MTHRCADTRALSVSLLPSGYLNAAHEPSFSLFLIRKPPAAENPVPLNPETQPAICPLAPPAKPLPQTSHAHRK